MAVGQKPELYEAWSDLANELKDSETAIVDGKE